MPKMSEIEISQLTDTSSTNQKNNNVPKALPLIGGTDNLINGHFYNYNGNFEGKFSNYTGDINDVYVCSGSSIEKDSNGNSVQIFSDYKKIDIKNDVFLRIAGLAYSESGYSVNIIKVIPFTVMNHHKQITESGISKYKNWTLNQTVLKMRNNWDDKTYAHTFHYGAQGNPAFRAFLGIKLNEAIDFDKNSKGRNNDSNMRLAIEYTIKAVLYLDGLGQEDYSEGGIGWQGADINTNKNWKNWLYIHEEHKKYDFAKWINANSLDQSIFESVMVSKGSFGTTLIYKSTKYSFKNSKTGNL